jgi:hypothetical protein
MDTEFELVQKDKTASVIGILGYIFVYLAANLAASELVAESSKEKEIYEKERNQTLLIASLLLLIALVIRGRISFIKLKEKQEKLVKGETSDSIIPDIYISSGYAMGIIGNSLRLIGNILRVKDSQE